MSFAVHVTNLWLLSRLNKSTKSFTLQASEGIDFADKHARGVVIVSGLRVS